MSNTHEEAREIVMKAEKHSMDYQNPRGFIPAFIEECEAALSARDEKHAREVEELREAMDVAIRKVYSEMKEHRKSSYLSGLSTGGGTALAAIDACRERQEGGKK